MRTPDNSQSPEVPWVFYDGRCGLCSHWVARWRPRLERQGFRLLPLEEMPERGFTAGEALSDDLDFLVRDEAQNLHRGADAYLLILSRLPGLRLLAHLFRLPFLHGLFRLGYAMIRRHRHRISKTCGLRPTPSS